MGKQTVYRVTGFFLSLTILCLGCGCTVLLYYAGQRGIDFVYTSQNLYKDAENVIRLREPSEEWYGEAMLRGWIAGFIYMLPGATGIITSVIYFKCPMILHLIVSILLLFVGSFLHTAGAMAILMYRLFINGAVRYDPLLGDCIFIQDDAIPLEYVDEQCMAGRKALIMAIAAVCLMFLSWIFIFSDILYRAFTYSNIKTIGRNSKSLSGEIQTPTPKTTGRMTEHMNSGSSQTQERDASNQEHAATEMEIIVVPGPSNSPADASSGHTGVTDRTQVGADNQGFVSPDDEEKTLLTRRLKRKRRAPVPTSSQEVPAELHNVTQRGNQADNVVCDEPNHEKNELETFGVTETERM